MKEKIVTGIIVLITFLLLSVVIYGSNKNNIKKKEYNPVESSIVVSSPSLDTNIFYWGETCPHCHDTIDWMEENNVDEKIKIIRKEISENEDNAIELIQNAKICGIKENEIGIPLMYTKNQKCLVGTPDITSYLREEINKLKVDNEVTN